MGDALTASTKYKTGEHKPCLSPVVGYVADVAGSPSLTSPDCGNCPSVLVDSTSYRVHDIKMIGKERNDFKSL